MVKICSLDCKSIWKSCLSLKNVFCCMLSILFSAGIGCTVILLEHRHISAEVWCKEQHLWFALQYINGILGTEHREPNFIHKRQRVADPVATDSHFLL